MKASKGYKTKCALKEALKIFARRRIKIHHNRQGSSVFVETRGKSRKNRAPSVRLYYHIDALKVEL